MRDNSKILFSLPVSFFRSFPPCSGAPKGTSRSKLGVTYDKRLVMVLHDCLQIRAERLGQGVLVYRLRGGILVSFVQGRHDEGLGDEPSAEIDTD